MPTDPTRLHSIFLAAVAADDRAAVLARECGDDSELRRRVEKLLAAHDDSAELPPAQPATGDYASAAIAQLAPGTLFAGRYKLRERLGEGGMGVVYVADQTQPVQRRVALKIIKSGLDTAKLQPRFEQERQALALMDHPNIAKVYDAGIAGEEASVEPNNMASVEPSGRRGRGDQDHVGLTPRRSPYFVMELVKGLPLTKYCDEAKLTPQQRLELFIPICQAVQHAHQKGVIHRDLKPSNILVGLYDGRPIPKIIDFGVAKMSGPRITEHSVYTEVGSIIGTLEYMSPEQAELNNLDIDTRTDIYALGVILYELLTGTVPFSRKEMQSAGFVEMLRIIKEQEPSKPSTKLSGSGSLPSVAACRHTEPAKLTRLVRGELDWITMKALEKDRTRRYETANGMAMDIQRYLDDEPVLASPPSAAYLFKKFVRRNRGQVIAASLVFLALVAGLCASLWQMNRANAERDAKDAALQAEAKARQAERMALDGTMKSLRSLSDEVIEYRWGNKVLSEENKEFLRAIIRHFRELANSTSDDAAVRSIRADTLTYLARMDLELGELKDAENAVTAAVAIYKELAADFPTQPEFREDLAASHNTLGILLGDTGRTKEAEAAYTDALAIWKQLAIDFPTRPEFRKSLGRTDNNLGDLLYDMDRLTEAEAAFTNALVILKQLAADFPDNTVFRNDLARTFVNLAFVYNQRREFTTAKKCLAEAEPHHQAALKGRRNPSCRQYYRSNLNALAQANAGLGDPVAAVQTAEKRRDLGWDPPADAYDAACALALCIPIVEKDNTLDREKKEAAVKLYGDEAMTMLRAAVGKGYKDVAEMKQDTVLDPLRDREDFKKLIAELEKK